MGIRVAVVDDNPHVAWEGRVFPVNATFHRFLSAVIDVPGRDGAPFVERLIHCVPLRAASGPPMTAPLDPRLEIVGTRPFEGIAGYLRRWPALARANARILGPILTEADLVWLKVPASNAPLAAWLAWRAGVPRFVYVAGSARDVVKAQRRSRTSRSAAFLAAGIYDLAGLAVATGGHRLVVGADLSMVDAMPGSSGDLSGPGIVTSLVEAEDVVSIDDRAWPAEAGALRLVWAGRLAGGKGIETLLDALAILVSSETSNGPRHRLVMLGDGPARGAMERRAAGLGVADRVEWAGYIADRTRYLDAMRAGDVFVHPSPAEGFPKVVLDAMASALPVVARPSGQLGAIASTGLFLPTRTGAPGALADAIARLATRPAEAAALARSGGAFAARHTRPAEAARLVERWQAWWPSLARD